MPQKRTKVYYRGTWNQMGNTTPSGNGQVLAFKWKKAKLESPLLQAAHMTSAYTRVLVRNFRGPGDAILQCYSTHVGPTPHISEVEALNVEIEEADERMVPNLMHTIHDGMQRMMVHTADNDVSILMMYYFWWIPPSGARGTLGESRRWT